MTEADPNAPKNLHCRDGHEFTTRGTPGSRVRCPECCSQGDRTRYRVPADDDIKLYGRKNREKRKAARSAARRAGHEAELPLTDSQRDLIARARQDLRLLNQAAARARLAQDRDAYGELLARRNEVSALLGRLVEDAEALAAEPETARIMTSRPRGRSQA